MKGERLRSDLNRTFREDPLEKVITTQESEGLRSFQEEKAGAKVLRQ